MKKVLFSMVFGLLLVAHVTEASDQSIIGVWNTHTYVVQGKEHELDGLIIFTERHFAGTGFSKFSGGEMDDSNANAGTYRVEGNKLLMQQQVQIHIRPGDEKEPIFYGKGVPEEATYEIEGDRLTIYFPSGNKYICDRLE